MLQSEFIQITGFQVSTECYKGFIEPEYDNSTLDKLKWCKQWKRKGGIAKAYSWQVNYDLEAVSKVKDLQAENEALKLQLKKAESEATTYQLAYERAKERLQEIREHITQLFNKKMFTL